MKVENVILVVVSVVLLMILFTGVFQVSADFFPSFLGSDDLPNMFEGDAWAFVLFGCIMVLVAVGGLAFFIKSGWG
jgi:hypothetical protein